MNRRIRVAKGLSINVSKSGLSTSAKVGRVTMNSRRGATVNVAKGVSYNIPAGSSGRATASRETPARATSVPIGPRQVRRPWGLPGPAFWTLGIFVSLLLGVIPAVGPFLLLAGIVALVIVWNVTPKRVLGEHSAPTLPTAPAADQTDVS